MTGEVVSFKGGPIPGEPDPLVIAALEDALDMARKGLLVSVGIAWVNSDGSAQWTMHAHMAYPLIASMSLMLHDFLASRQLDSGPPAEPAA